MLSRTEAAIEECKQFLASTDSDVSAIESYLMQYLLTLLCSEIQERLRERAVSHFGKDGDARMGRFIENTSTSHLMRGVRISSLSGFLGNFGSDIKDAFQEGLDDRDISLYSNVVRERINVAHGSGGQVTLRELEAALPVCQRVIEQFEAVLKYSE